MTNPTALKAIAEAATPGVWTVDADRHGETRVLIEVGDGAVLVIAQAEPEDATHIATFDPPTVLALLSEIEEKDRRIEALEKALEPFARFTDAFVKDADSDESCMSVPVRLLRQARSTLRTHPNGE